MGRGATACSSCRRGERRSPRHAGLPGPPLGVPARPGPSPPPRRASGHDLPAPPAPAAGPARPFIASPPQRSPGSAFPPAAPLSRSRPRPPSAPPSPPPGPAAGCPCQQPAATGTETRPVLRTLLHREGCGGHLGKPHAPVWPAEPRPGFGCRCLRPSPRLRPGRGRVPVSCSRAAWL